MVFLRAISYCRGHFTIGISILMFSQEYLDEYNSTARAEMHLVLFQDAVEHVVRVARVFRAERGHCLMVGPGGSGRRSVATLAGHVNECKSVFVSSSYFHKFVH